jgi:hypothetical protein
MKQMQQTKMPTFYAVKLCDSFAAHASTQHNNERLVKPGALMSSTGKSEIMASIFAMASNDFITEHHDDEREDTLLEIPGNQPEVAEDEPKRRKRRNYRGKNLEPSCRYDGLPACPSCFSATHVSFFIGGGMLGLFGATL